MYLIRLASGEERTYATIDDLAAAVQRGEVQQDAAIFHRRTKQWLPLEHHPYFAFATGEYKAAPPAEPAKQEPQPPAVRDVDPTGTGSLLQEEERLNAAPSNVAPLRPGPPAEPPSRRAGHPGENRGEPPPPAPRYEPVAPTPLRVPKPVASPAVESREPRVERRQASPSPRPATLDARPSTLDRRPPTAPPRRTSLVIAVIVILGSAIGILVGLKLRETGSSPANDGPVFRPAPPPSAMLDDTTALTNGSSPNRTPGHAVAARVDPTAPVSAEQLMERRRNSYLDVQSQLGRDLAAVDFNGIFGVRAVSTPDGARAARRVVASALNVLGQFHRREVMTDRAYEDTAAFQTTQAGWTREQIAAWQNRPTLKEPYQSADLAESLLADADSLLNILGSSSQWTVDGDSLQFPDSSRAAAYRAQRARLTERAGPPVTDTTARPSLAYVRGAVNPDLLPK